jgi:galactose oxidase
MRWLLAARSWKVAAVALLVVGGVVLAWPAGVVRSFVAAAPSDTGQWSAVQTTPTVPIHMHLLADGRAMLWLALDSPYIWDLASGTFSAAASVGYNILCSGHTFLPDGRLLVSGGHVDTWIGLPFLAIYDPAANSWTQLPEMNRSRWYPTTTVLPDGDVLITGGTITVGMFARVPEIWQTSSGTLRELPGAALAVESYPMMFVAPNGKVFAAGPKRESYYLDTAGEGSWTFVANSSGGTRIAGTAVMYADGKILLVGGGAGGASKTAEVIDLNASTPRWRAVDSMAFARKQHNATLLPDGTVLVTGGHSGSGHDNPGAPVYAAELWDPTTERWTTMASDTVYRGYHSSAILTTDGRVISGGGNVGGASAAFFSPPYLFKGQRPTLTSAPATVGLGQTFFVGTPDAADITKVTWLRLSSATHSFNESQRINTLAFSQSQGGLNVTAPGSANLAQPGDYLLFVLNGNGVPSVAKIVRLHL